MHERGGRKALYVASHASHIVEWPEEDGRALLDELLAFATQPQFIYAHQWQVGDENVAAWPGLTQSFTTSALSGANVERTFEALAQALRGSS